MRVVFVEVAGAVFGDGDLSVKPADIGKAAHRGGAATRGQCETVTRTVRTSVNEAPPCCCCRLPMCDRLQAGEINPTVERGWRRGSETYRSPVHPGDDPAAARGVEFGERFGVLILDSRRPDSGRRATCRRASTISRAWRERRLAR
jgi:hypothetical protein